MTTYFDIRQDYLIFWQNPMGTPRMSIYPMWHIAETGLDNTTYGYTTGSYIVDAVGLEVDHPNGWYENIDLVMSDLLPDAVYYLLSQLNGAAAGSAQDFTWSGNLILATRGVQQLVDLKADISSLGTASAEDVSHFALASHTHTASEITDFSSAADARITVQKGANSGLCPLDSSGLVASANLPSYVDDVLEYANLGSLPGTGATGKIYVTLNDNKCFRWSGSVYIEVSPGPGSTDAVAEGSTNLYFTNARARSAVRAYQGTTAKDGSFPIFKSATVSSGTAVFHITSDGTSGGSALFPNGPITESLNCFVSDSAASYQMAGVWSNSNKTLTVTTNKLGTANILTGILGQVAGNGAVVNIQVWGN